jgi:hypothetical protein
VSTIALFRWRGSSVQARASFTASQGSYPRAWKGVGHGGCPRAALAGRGEVAGAMGELRGVWHGAKDATGKTAGLWDGLYSRGAGVVTCGRGRAGVRALACSERAPRVSARVEHVGACFCHGSTADLSTLACISWQNHCVRSLPCSISYLFAVSSKPRYGQGGEIEG